MKLSLEEICIECGVEENLIKKFVHEEWILPADAESFVFDHEDVARIYFIRDLMDSFEVNDEAVPIILDLVDQIFTLRRSMKEDLCLDKKTK